MPLLLSLEAPPSPEALRAPASEATPHPGCPVQLPEAPPPAPPARQRSAGLGSDLVAAQRLRRAERTGAR